VSGGEGGLSLLRASFRACPLLADFVAKVGGPLQLRNYRIQRARRLNQSCAPDRFLESMLRVGTQKIFLQQYRHLADISIAPAFVRYWSGDCRDPGPKPANPKMAAKRLQ
jgi:hypothetical protein